MSKHNQIAEFFDTAKKYKKKYEKFKETFELVRDLLDDDSRSAALYREALELVLRRIGRNISKTPFAAYHQYHLEKFYSTIEDSQTHSNAKEALKTARAGFERMESEGKSVAMVAQRALEKHKATVRSILSGRNSLGFDWYDYVNDISINQFPSMRGREIAEEIFDFVKVGSFLAGEVKSAQESIITDGFTFLERLLSLMSVGAQAVLAEKIYFEKVEKLVESKSPVGRVLGLSERRNRALEALISPGKGSKNSFSVAPTLESVVQTATLWVEFLEIAQTPHVFLFNPKSVQ